MGRRAGVFATLVGVVCSAMWTSGGFSTRAGSSTIGRLPASAQLQSDYEIVTVERNGSLFGISSATGQRRIIKNVGGFGVAVDSDGTTFLTAISGGSPCPLFPTHGCGALYRLDSDGTLTTLSDFGDSGAGPTGTAAYGVAIEASGSILVVDRFYRFHGALFRVDRVTGVRSVLSDFADVRQGELGREPFGVAVDSDGTILVIDPSAGTACHEDDTDGCGALFRVNPNDGNRTRISDFGNPSQGDMGDTPVGVAVAADRTYLVIDGFAGGPCASSRQPCGALFSVDRTGTRRILSDFGDASQGTQGTSALGQAVGVAVGPDGAIFVSGCLPTPSSSSHSICRIDGVTGFREPVGNPSDPSQGPVGDFLLPLAIRPRAQATTSLEIASSTNPSFVGQPVTFTASVTSAGGGRVPTGTVLFEENGVPLGTSAIDASGIATVTTSTLALGNHVITATYPGSVGFLGNSTTVLQRVTAPVDLEVVKTVSSTTGTAGQALTYSLHIRNNGPADATGVVVRDTLPANVTVNDAPTTCTLTGSVISCPIGNLAATHDVLLTIAVTPDAPGVFVNSADIRGNEADPVSLNNQSSVTTIVDAVDLAVSLADGPDPVVIGGTLTYIVGVSNLSPAPARSATLTFTTDASLTLTAFSVTGLTGVACSGGPMTSTCNLGTLAGAAQGTITFKFTTTVVGVVSATARIASPHPETIVTNNAATVTTTVDRGTDLAVVAIADSPDPAPVTAAVTYLINVVNNGPVTDTGVTVTGILAGPAVFDTSAPPPVLPVAGTCTVAPTTFSCQGGQLVFGQATVLTLRALPTAVGTLTLSVTISGKELELSPANNTATESTIVFVPQPPVLTLAPIYAAGASYRIAPPEPVLGPIYTAGASYRIAPPELTLAPIYTAGASYRIAPPALTLSPIYTQGASYQIVNTTTGSPVTVVSSGGIRVTFSSVTSPGTTTVTPIAPSTAGPLPSGYVEFDGLAYDIATTATTSGPITVTFTVSSATDSQVFASLRVLHGESGGLVDRTVLTSSDPFAPNFATKTISARVSSLSPFVIARRVITPPTDVGARSLKQSAIRDLEALPVHVIPQRHRDDLRRAIISLRASIDSRLWIDQTHVHSLVGPPVFDLEWLTVVELSDLRHDCEGIDELIDRIVRADRLLASVALDEAVAGKGSSEMIGKAQRALADGDRDAAAGRPDRAITRYRDAWQHARDALIKKKK